LFTFIFQFLFQECNKNCLKGTSLSLQGLQIICQPSGNFLLTSGRMKPERQMNRTLQISELWRHSITWCKTVLFLVIAVVTSDPVRPNSDSWLSLFPNSTDSLGHWPRSIFIRTPRSGVLFEKSRLLSQSSKVKVKLSLQQAVRAHRVVRRWGFHIFQTVGSQTVVRLSGCEDKYRKK
jgi:hypothetical protein